MDERRARRPMDRPIDPTEKKVGVMSSCSQISLTGFFSRWWRRMARSLSAGLKWRRVLFGMVSRSVVTEDSIAQKRLMSGN